jgi:protein O-mannosyl-transferase
LRNVATGKKNRKPGSRRRRNEIASASRLKVGRLVPTVNRSPGWLRPWVACLFLITITSAVYSSVRHNPFIDYDDQAYVVNNLHVQSGLNWDTFVWAFTTTNQENWHPLTWLSHALDCQLFGSNAGAHHITNVCIHVANVVLLFLLLELVTGRRGASLLVAALFALHPFNVDSVAWIAERKNLLSTFFFLLSLGGYGWYARKPDWRRYIPFCLLFILSLLAKPMMVTFPFVLLLVDYWPLHRVEGWCFGSAHFPVPRNSVTRLIVEKIPLLALAGISSVVTIIAQKNAIQPLEAMPFVSRLENAIASYFLYVWKTVVPANFAIYYPNPFDTLAKSSGDASGWAPFAAGAVLLLAVSWLAWRQRHVRPYLIVGWLWYLGTLVPVIGIVQVGPQGMADRYAYIPLIGLFVIASWGAGEIADYFNIKFSARSAGIALVLAALSLLTIHQLGYWRTGLSLWLHAVEVTRNNVRANDHVGFQFTAQRRPDDALPYFEEAARLDPRDPDSHLAVGAHLQDTGHLHEAIRNYEVVVHESIDPQQVVFGYFNLCLIFGELGDFSRANEALSRAQTKSPELTAAKVQELQSLVTAQPSDEGYLRLGILAEETGEISAAHAAYERALQMNPSRIETQRALDHLLASSGKMP